MRAYFEDIVTNDKPLSNLYGRDWSKNNISHKKGGCSVNFTLKNSYAFFFASDRTRNCPASYAFLF